ncbi:MAG TPA: hypothetical protein VN515_00660, partial [Terriglobales bacterium]|nr:hypothetical protein [Terriglobales bacterium]
MDSVVCKKLNLSPLIANDSFTLNPAGGYQEDFLYPWQKVRAFLWTPLWTRCGFGGKPVTDPPPSANRGEFPLRARAVGG